jgi:hypothetical protein
MASDWYEREFLARTTMPGADLLGVERALLERFAEGAEPTPAILAVRARK